MRPFGQVEGGVQRICGFANIVDIFSASGDMLVRRIMLERRMHRAVDDGSGFEGRFVHQKRPPMAVVGRSPPLRGRCPAGQRGVSRNAAAAAGLSSEARRVGKEGASTFTSRWAPD